MPRCRPLGTRHIVLLVIIGLAIAVAAALAPTFLPSPPIPREEQPVEGFYLFLLVLALLIFVPVQALLVYSAIRTSGACWTTQDKPFSSGHKAIEVAWALVPPLLAMAAGIYTYLALT